MERLVRVLPISGYKLERVHGIFDEPGDEVGGYIWEYWQTFTADQGEFRYIRTGCVNEDGECSSQSGWLTGAGRENTAARKLCLAITPGLDTWVYCGRCPANLRLIGELTGQLPVDSETVSPG